MSEITITDRLYKDGNGRLVYELDWSDCPHLMRYASHDQLEVLRIRSALIARQDAHLKGNQGFITSDLDLEYIKKEN